MTRKTSSDINQATINENFPVPGQDNDTQVFRDNFDSIKTNLRRARDEINILLDGEDGATFKSDPESNFNRNVLRNFVFVEERMAKNPPLGGFNDLQIDQEISFLNGSYQIYRLPGDRRVQFTNFPGDPRNVGESIPVGVGKITLELYSTTPPGELSPYKLSFSTDSGALIKSNPGLVYPIPINPGPDPTFIEVWRHRQDEIFIRYIGQFSQINLE